MSKFYQLRFNLFAYVILFILLSYSFVFNIVPVFSWFELNINFIKIFFSFLANLVIVIFLPVDFKKPSSIFMHIQYLFPILPMLIMFGISDLSSSYMIMVLAGFYILLLTRNINLRPLHFQKISRELLIIFFFFMISIIILFEIIVNGKSLNFNFFDIYIVRLENELTSSGGIMGYLIALTSTVFIPFLLILSLHRKSIVMIMSSLVLAIFFFGITNYKSALFYPFLVVAIYFFLSRTNPIRDLLISLLILTFFSIAVFPSLTEGELIGSDFLRVSVTALGVRRVFFEPSLINFFYYEFFKLNEFVYWSNSNLTFGLFDYPYSLDPAHQIGFYFYGTELQGANTGWLGSGYMNAGYLGVYLYAFLLGLIFSFIDSYKNLIDSKYLVAFTISPLFVLFLSSDFFSALLTHGIALSIILLFFISNQSSSSKYKFI